MYRIQPVIILSLVLKALTRMLSQIVIMMFTIHLVSLAEPDPLRTQWVW